MRENYVMIGAVDLTAEVMRQTFETNVFGIVRVLHAFLPHPTRQYTNPNLLVNGPEVTVKPAHAKIRRDGYRKT